jgi:hypothetical protein
MNNKNLKTMYGGNFNQSDYNVSLLDSFNPNKTGGFDLSKLAKLATQASKAIKGVESAVNKGTAIANKASELVDKTSSSMALLNKNNMNDCITIAQKMTPDEINVMITKLQSIVADKLKK